MIVGLWTLVALLGAVVSAASAVDAWHDVRASRLIARNGRQVIAAADLRRELIRFAIQAIWVFVGATAWASGAGGTLTLAVALLMATNALVALNSVLDLRDRLTWRHRFG